MFWPILEALIVIQTDQMIILKLYSLEQNALVKLPEHLLG